LNPLVKEPAEFGGKVKEAFFKAISEYNSYEMIAHSKRFQIDSNAAFYLYGFCEACLVFTVKFNVFI